MQVGRSVVIEQPGPLPAASLCLPSASGLSLVFGAHSLSLHAGEGETTGLADLPPAILTLRLSHRLAPLWLPACPSERLCSCRQDSAPALPAGWTSLPDIFAKLVFLSAVTSLDRPSLPPYLTLPSSPFPAHQCSLLSRGFD